MNDLQKQIIQDPGQVIFAYSIITSPLVSVMIVKCATCDHELARLDLDDPAPVPQDWWKCPNGCNDEELQA